jgi:hypothetical protein
MIQPRLFLSTTPIRFEIGIIGPLRQRLALIRITPPDTFGLVPPLACVINQQMFAFDCQASFNCREFGSRIILGFGATSPM